MIDISQHLVNKLVLCIDSRSKESGSVPAMTKLQEILYETIASSYDLPISWSAFISGCSFANQNKTLIGKSIANSENQTVWALTMKLTDQTYMRRRWIYRIGMRAVSDTTAKLYYAKCYYDHMAGSIAEPHPVTNQRDQFLDELLFHDQVQCLCGSHCMPMEPIELKRNGLKLFLEMVYDTMRTVPIILITCAWYISPEQLHDKMLGNTVIFWCDDASIVISLNERLPKHMYTNWDSVRIFMPTTGPKIFHPQYSVETIRKMGVQNFEEGLCQAYCRSFCSEDYRNFITLEDILKENDRRQTLSILEEKKQKESELREAKERNAALIAENEEFRKKISTLSACKKDASIEECETLLSEVMKENDIIKDGIMNVCARLYGSIGKRFQEDETESNAIIRELSHAIQTYSASTGMKKRS